jgi:hypothetical protein
MFRKCLCCIKKKHKKKIKFHEYVYITYIPPIEKSIYNLWWSKIDIHLFKHASVNELEQLMERHPSMNYKDAIRLLYQPGSMNIKYDKSYFDL